MGIAEVLLISVYSESFSLGYSAPGVPSFWIWLCESWLLIEFSLNLQKAWSTKSSFGSNFILFLCTTSWTPFFCFFFYTMANNLTAIAFDPWTQKTKAAHDEHVSGDKSLSGTWYRRIRLTSRCVWLRIVSPEIINLIFLGGGILSSWLYYSINL